MAFVVFPIVSLSQIILQNVKCFSQGEITIELYWKHAPNTCRNFAELVRRGYYNNTVFHRIIRDFMIQGGDPSKCHPNVLYIFTENRIFIRYISRLNISAH